MDLKKSNLKKTIIRVLREEEEQEKKLSPNDRILNLIDKINRGEMELETIEKLFGSLSLKV